MVGMTTCERIGHQFADDLCRGCGKQLAETGLTVGERVYDPTLLPVGAVISSPPCGPVTVTGADQEYLHTTACQCGESKIRLKAAAWRCGGVTLEALP